MVPSDHHCLEQPPAPSWGRDDQYFLDTVRSCNSLSFSLETWLFALPFFTTEDNIRFGYLIGTAMILLAIIPLLLQYKALVNLGKPEED